MSRFSKLARVAAVAVVVTTALASTPAIAATSYPVKLKAAATGAMETAGGSMSGTGSGTFTIKHSQKLFCYNIKAKGLTGINGSHIHKGAAGVDGAVVIALNAKKIDKGGTPCVKASASVLADISMHPGNYYFNVHTAKYPAGAVRGQLSK
jgi:hypothetical protein